MINTLKEQIEETITIIEEIRIYDNQKQQKHKITSELYKQYQNKQLSYSEYEQKKDKILQHKTRHEWDEHYDAYIYSLLKKVELLNKSILLKINHIDPSTIILSEKKIVETQIAKTPSITNTKNVSTENTRLNNSYGIDDNEDAKEYTALYKTSSTEHISFWKILLLFIKSLFTKDKTEYAKAKEKVKTSKIIIDKIKSDKITFTSHSVKDNKNIIHASRASDNKGFLGNIFSKEYIIRVLKKFAGIEDNSIVKQTLKKSGYDSIQNIDLKAEGKVEDTSLLNDERERLNRLLNAKELTTYSVSKFGTFANVIFKKFTLTLLNKYPELFKKLNDALRLADIKILSITYVNMMIFSTLLSFFAGIPIFFILFLILKSSFIGAIFKTVLASTAFAVFVFIAFYSNPFSVINKRSKSIELNLPFAVNHLASISSSGIAPARMFHLVAESDEYKEISIEIKKIVEYMEIFGYDLVTAIMTVAISTPNKMFKEFLEGFTSNIQSGGELTDYLEQKSKELIDAYELKRQSYVETIATFSDIYTGAMIAAPLFFIITLSLVSVIGGQIGNVNVSVIIIIGTYVVIPLINLAFMAFLQITALEN